MEPNRDLTVLCVDDNADVAAAIGILLRSQPGMRLAGSLTNPARVLEEIRELRPNVVVLDFTMPGIETTELIRTIAGRFPESRVLVYSGYDQPEKVGDLLGAGAWGLVSKHGEPEELVEAIRRVGRGEAVFKRG
jgi:DNA-binding NarL/FixJ family response regulator